jgi:hypothetical protein
LAFGRSVEPATILEPLILAHLTIRSTPENENMPKSSTKK